MHMHVGGIFVWYMWPLGVLSLPTCGTAVLVFVCLFCLILSARNCLSFSSFYSVCVVKHFAVAKKLIALTIWLKYQRLNNDVIRSIFGNKYNI